MDLFADANLGYERLISVHIWVSRDRFILENPACRYVKYLALFLFFADYLLYLHHKLKIYG